MKFTFEYLTQQERDTLLITHKDKYLIQEHIVKEGNFLVFNSIKPIELETEELKKSQSDQDDLLMDIMLGGM